MYDWASAYNYVKCPTCKKTIEIEEIYKKNKTQITYGIVSCKCNKHPVIEGIICLKNSPNKTRAIKYLKKEEYHKSVLIMLQENKPKKIHRKALRYLTNIIQAPYHKIMENMKFNDLILPGIMGEYFKARFSTESFWTIYPTMYLISRKKKIENIGDLACGAGHSSFLFSYYLQPKNLFSQDYSFWHLYLLRKYFTDDSYCICSDLNEGLPFHNDIIDAVHLLDSFMYIKEKKVLAVNIEESIREEGIVFSSHLHNSLQHNEGQGHALTPREWGKLFTKIHTNVVPEKNYLEDFLYKNKIDLKRSYEYSELNKFNVIDIIGNVDSSEYADIWNFMLKNKTKLIVNPLYVMNKSKNKIILNRKLPNEFIRDRYDISMNYLPVEKIIDNDNIINNINGRKLNIDKIKEENIETIEELMKKFILINAPSKYA